MSVVVLIRLYSIIYTYDIILFKLIFVYNTIISIFLFFSYINSNIHKYEFKGKILFGKIIENSLNSKINLNKIDSRLKLCSYFIVKIGLILFVSYSRISLKKSSNSDLK